MAQAMPRQVTGTSYSEMVDKLHQHASDVNGEIVVDMPSGAVAVPRAANMHVIALWQALRRAAARGHDVMSEAEWQFPWLAMGWNAPGDKFVDTRAQAEAAFDPDMLPEMWQAAQDIAGAIDAQQTVVRPLYLDYSYPKAYQQAERDGWEAMKRYGVQVKLPLPGRDPIDIDPEKVVPIPPDKLVPSIGFPWWLVALVVVVVGSRSKRNRSK